MVVWSPHDPAIAMTGEKLGSLPVAMLRPAHDAINGVNARRSVALPERRAAGVAKRSEIEQQGGFPAGLPRQRQGFQREGVGKPAPIGRVGDDVARAGRLLGEKIDAGFAEPVGETIRADDLVSGCRKDFGDSSIPARGLPNRAVEWLDRQERPNRFGRRRIELVRNSARNRLPRMVAGGGRQRPPFPRKGTACLRAVPMMIGYEVIRHLPSRARWLYRK